MNARIERFFGTLKAQLNQWCVHSYAGLQASIDEFEFWYNTIRSHQHLAGRTPLEAWNKIDQWMNLAPFSRWTLCDKAASPR